MQQFTWFFSLKEPLSPEMKEALSGSFAAFLNQWKSHGTPVDGMIDIRHDQFVIVQADPEVERPSGCSIDSLKRSVSTILTHHQLEWLEAGYVFFRNSAGDVQSVHFREIPSLVENGVLTEDTIVFDNSLAQSDDLSRWELPLKQTWLKRYLQKVA